MGDLNAKEAEVDALKTQVQELRAKLESSDSKLRQEKNKVKEVIQAQRDVRRSINALNSKNETSPGKPDS